jgi:CRISPR system Cascade subunit CasE
MMFLSRLTLKRSPDVAALAQVLTPEGTGARLDAHHRLLWSAFAGDGGRTRDFLWRDMGRGVFLVLSPRPPRDSALFEEPEVTPFAPDLAAGDRLAFVLRANATRTVSAAGGKKRHHDVVMDALHAVPAGERALVRLECAEQAGRSWLAGQGTRAGFIVHDAAVTAYDVAEAPPVRRTGRPRFGILHLEGLIEVTDPVAFLARFRWPPGAAATGGFGRAKAFGCGLMLIRRA